ncbi:hypothetical protein BKA83DRAFT_4493958 [Pisolithus microcarpus]|nr:hypothetical protein BKA83DRAFT_4493958 [Pisolithus microcarpus]
MALLLSIMVCAFSSTVFAASTPQKTLELYHTSILSGEGWVIELLTGHPECIHNELGMHADIFDQLILILRQHGHMSSKSFCKTHRQMVSAFEQNDITRCIPVALCAIHNFIQLHEPDTITNDKENGMEEDEEDDFFEP